MKQGHAAGGAPNCGASKGIAASIAEASAESGHAERTRRPQVPLRAQEHSFVVNWELQEWLAAEQDWFPKGSGA